MEKDLQIISAAVTDRGLSEKRPENEDSFLEMEACGIFAVADGVGGSQGGEVASQMAMEMLSEAFANRPQGADAEDVLRAAIESANAAIYQMAKELPKLWNMATTIVALHLADNIATIGHVGDSRLYRVDPRGGLYRETEDHSVVADEVRAGRMTEDQAELHPSRNVISRALGAESTVEADIKTILIDPGTTFLICSDGITRHVSDDEIRAILTAGSPPDSICSYLKTLCYERGAHDNLTAVVVTVGSNANQRVVPASLPISADEEDTVATGRGTSDEIVADESETNAAETPDENIVEKQPAIQAPDHRVFSSTGKFLSSDESAYLDADQKPDSGFMGKALAAAGMLLIGCLIGAGAYHFMVISPPAPQPAQLSEMKSENISFTSFEKLRRTVDNDAAAYIKEIPPPQDAEDFYLQGRAYLLTGDYIKARTSLVEAQKRLDRADTSNAKVLTVDIAAALVIVNDSDIQRRFKGEIENSAKASASPVANANVNR